MFLKLVCHVQLIAALALGILFTTAPSSQAGDDGNSGQNYYAGLTCQQLWHERNAIFARHGYCFENPRAIAVFGKGCQPPFGKLPSNLQSVVNEIKAWESKRGC
ncbi:YARHG domain-containing protein [Filomicrobium sp.]|uniref:YARHG domain-containing protein n=1 Tax=Filomicrobium TaxID=119044 RepID=UPI000971529A|nr:YARHG domain-containing protein [Filomicrobium sp.]MCV0369662.1 YARHG domain-containing protein [Filomicrobium sp.]